MISEKVISADAMLARSVECYLVMVYSVIFFLLFLLFLKHVSVEFSSVKLFTLYRI